MRNINFMNPMPKSRQRELKRWMLFSVLLIGTVSLALGSLIIMQWRVYSQTAQEKNKLAVQLNLFDEMMKKERSHKEQEQLLHKKLSHLEQCKNCTTTPLAIISSLDKYIKPLSLQSLTLDAESFEIKGLCDTPKQATMVVNAIQKAPFCNSAHLASLSTNKQQLCCVIKGTMRQL